MPIPRRISQSALSAIQPAQSNDRSGTYPVPLPQDDDEFAHFGELPSLMPPRNSPVLRLVENEAPPPPRAAPKTYRSGQMPAVRVYDATPSFGDDDERGNDTLVLDLEVTPRTQQTGMHKIAPPPPAPPARDAAAPLSTPTPTPTPKAAAPAPIPLGGMSGTYLAAAAPGDPKPGIVAFAGYGFAPTKLSQAPGYAFRVMMRRATLRSDLKIARMRRLPQREIELYEAALRCADEAAVTKGIAVVVSSIVGVVGVIAAVAAAVL